MTSFEDYMHRVRLLLASLSGYLTDIEQEEISYLIDHDECGEALRTLAWIVVEENKRIPVPAIATIKELSVGLVADQDMPPDLDSHASD